MGRRTPPPLPPPEGEGEREHSLHSANASRCSACQPSVGQSGTFRPLTIPSTRWAECSRLSSAVTVSRGSTRSNSRSFRPQTRCSRNAIGKGGASGDGAPTFAELVRRYSEPHRKYHTLQHLEECISCFEASSHLAQWPAEVEAALWFHDAIYDLGRTDNEEQSGNWAHAALSSAGVPDDAAARVETLVRATKHTSLPASQDEQLLVDIDLSILGADEQRFGEYEVQIRDEYSIVA